MTMNNPTMTSKTRTRMVLMMTISDPKPTIFQNKSSNLINSFQIFYRFGCSKRIKILNFKFFFKYLNPFSSVRIVFDTMKGNTCNVERSTFSVIFGISLSVLGFKIHCAIYGRRIHHPGIQIGKTQVGNGNQGSQA